MFRRRRPKRRDQWKEAEEQIVQNKRRLAFGAFRLALENRLKQEGRLKVMPERMKDFGSLG